jgi:hypothetical protein
MLLYNVTVKIDQQIAEEWLSWMRSVHIPDVLATGCFQEHRLARLLSMEEEDDPTFTIQYLCPNQETLNRYFEDHAPALQRTHKERYHERFVAFRSIMEIL